MMRGMRPPAWTLGAVGQEVVLCSQGRVLGFRGLGFV